MKKKGVVYLVGAGPGAAGLLTLRGAELLGRADVVLYDALVNPDLLRLAPPGAEVIFAGKRPREQAMSQEKLNRLLVSKARQGSTVVRLKGGDPYIFGRGGEEAEELAEAGVSFEVVPGVSSVFAVPGYAGIPLTHREHCSGFTVVTGHEDASKPATVINWRDVARAPGTKVIMMGTERIGSIAARLVREGMPDDTPVAMIRWGTTGRQRSIEGTLATIGVVAEKAAFKAPSVAVIGDVVRLRDKLGWFERRPLFGKRVVVTRAREKAADLSQRLREMGAEVIEIPTIKIAPPEDKQDLMDAILGLHEYDWVVFTSPNGVGTFFDYFFKAFEDIREIGGVRFAAVGPATAASLASLHLKVDVVPEEYEAARIAEALSRVESIENLRVLLVRAEVANPVLPAELERLGAIVDDVACYRTVPETDESPAASENLRELGADWITFTSGSTVENFHRRFDLPGLLARFPALRLASIGPETSKAIIKLGLKPAIEAREHTLDGLVEALLEAVRAGR